MERREDREDQDSSKDEATLELDYRVPEKRERGHYVEMPKDLDDWVWCGPCKCTHPKGAHVK